MTDLDLDAIEARANAATEGPWKIDIWPGNKFYGRGWEIVTAGGHLIAEMQENTGNDAQNADFIAHASTDVPALIARVRELEAEVERLRENPIRYIHAGSVTDEQRTKAHASRLYAEGDMRLVWVNECDLSLGNAVEIHEANKCGAGHENCPGYHYDAEVKVYHSYADYCDV